MFIGYASGGEVGWWYAGLLALGCLIGIVTGLFGVGGGFLLTPALRIFFNVPYPIAVGSGLMHILINILFSTYRHWRLHNIDTKLGLLMAAGSLGGAELGIRLLTIAGKQGSVTIGNASIDYLDLVISLSFLVLLSAVAIYTLYESLRAGTDEVDTWLAQKLQTIAIPPMMTFAYSPTVQRSVWLAPALSFFVGCLTGLLGIGGGFINFPLMIYLLGVPTRLAVGTSSFQVLFVSLYCVVRYWQQGNIDLGMVLIMLIGSVAGVRMGVKICQATAGRNVRKYFAFLLIGAILVISYYLLNRMRSNFNVNF